jgi:hypothetical protein
MIDITSLDGALRLTEILLAFAFMQQSAEHFTAPKGERTMFMLRFILSGVLLLGLYTPWVCLVLLGLSIVSLQRFNGPYNGGSDRMNILIISCLTLVHFMPSVRGQEYVLGYLALQLILSYFMAGKVKVMNSEWRSGRALNDVFAFSAYPVSEGLRGFASHSQILRVMSWAVIVFELAFPFSILSQGVLVFALCIACLFHFANACLFGLNRFFWVWLAAYPSLIWLQARLFTLG